MPTAVPGINPPAVEGYNFAYLDEQTKRMIRRSLLKAVAIPGYQVPFGSREMPLPYGWGTGGIQVTAAIIGPRTIHQLTDLLAGQDVVLDDATLDRIDDIVPPGITPNPVDAGFQAEWLANAERRRLPPESRAAG